MAEFTEEDVVAVAQSIFEPLHTCGRGVTCPLDQQPASVQRHHRTVVHAIINAYHARLAATGRVVVSKRRGDWRNFIDPSDCVT